MQTVQELLRSAGTSNQSTLIDPKEYENARCGAINSIPGNLTGYDCPECKNRGYFAVADEKCRITMKECKCMAIRRSMEAAKRSGMQELMERCTLDSWETKEPWQSKLLNMARKWVNDRNGWFYVAGTPGTGKTHICSGICTALVKTGVQARYMTWRDVSVQAKAVVNDEYEYRKIVDPLKNVDLLYIDDFLKTGKGHEPTVADVNLAFEILNHRYNHRELLTVISSEMTVEMVLNLDEAVGSRVYERSKGYYADLTGKKNWRLMA